MRTAVAVLVGFVIALAFVIPTVLLGYDTITAGIGTLAGILVAALVVVAVLCAILFLARKWILKTLLGSAATRVEEVTDPLKEAITAAVRGDNDTAVEQAGNSLKAGAALYTSYNMHRWIVTTLFGVLTCFGATVATWITIKQSQLQKEQNEFLKEQNKFLDAQNRLLETQNKSAEMQATAAKVQNSPHFVVQAKQIPGQDDGVPHNDEMSVENIGAPARDLKVETAIFLKVELNDPKLASPNWSTHLLPLLGYYFVQVSIGKSQGLMVTLSGKNNNDRFSTLYTDFLKLANQGKRLGSADLERYAKLTYKNQFNELQTEYYYVRPVIGGMKIEAHDGERFFTAWDMAFVRKTMLQFESLTAQQVLDLVTKK